jgi:hypothetical protein
MFARKSCYFFVRPRRKTLELIVFLGRTMKAPQVRRTDAVSRNKIAHTVHITHRDQVEAPITDWLREAYELSETLTARPKRTESTKRSRRASPRRAPARRKRQRSR